MYKSLQTYTSYKAYLQDRIRSEPRQGHGFRGRMAEAMGCQLSYLSHVLGGERHLSVEQAEALTRFLGMNEDEREYFIFLLEYDRAGTTEAQKFFARLLEEKREMSFQKRVRVESATTLDSLSMAEYVSSYLYIATHSLIMIEDYRTPQAIAERLNIEMAEVTRILQFLKRNGLVAEDRGRLQATSKYVFIDRDSPFVLQHHWNWRLLAMQNAARRTKTDQHLSFALTLSEKDAKLLRARITEMVDEVQKVAKASREEKLMGFNIDFFSV